MATLKLSDGREIKLGLEEMASGTVFVTAEATDGGLWYVAAFCTDGTLAKCGGMDFSAFQTNRNGEIKVMPSRHIQVLGKKRHMEVDSIRIGNRIVTQVSKLRKERQNSGEN